MSQVKQEIKERLEDSDRWGKLASTKDSGSYCESGEGAYYDARKIEKLYDQLVDALIEWKRKHE